MSLYDKHTTYMILIVVGLMHILSIVFMCIFTVKFLINDHTPAAYLLLAILIIPLLVVDYFGFIKTNAFAKFLLRFSVTETGIHFYGIGWRSWDILWSSICIYGIVGYKSETVFPAIFICTNPNEKFNKYGNTDSDYLFVNKTQVCFQINDKIWNYLSKHMPDDMTKKLKYSLTKQEDCFHRRRIN